MTMTTPTPFPFAHWLNGVAEQLRGKPKEEEPDVQPKGDEEEDEHD